MKKKQSTKRTFKRSLLTSSILLELSIGSAVAATINVDGVCTLADAITSANTDLATGSCTAGAGDDVIQVVSPNSTLTISSSVAPSTLSGNVGLPVIASNVTIEGNGLTIRALPQAPDYFRVFEVVTPLPIRDNRGLITPVTFTLRDTTVSGANDGLGASGLLAYVADVTLENCNFNRNAGGVFLGYGTNQIDNTIIRANNRPSTGAPLAAGLHIANSTVSITNSSIVDNKNYYAGFGLPRTPNLRESRGGSSFPTGGIAIENPSSVSITNSTISGNAAQYGGGIGIFGTMSTVTTAPSNSFLKGEHRGLFPSTLTITNSTITNNSSFLAGGIVSLSDLADTSIRGSIVAGNNAFYDFGREIYITEPNTLALNNYNLIGNKNNLGLAFVELGETDIRNQEETVDVLYPLTLSNEQFLHPAKQGSSVIDGLPLATACFGLFSDQEQNPRALDGDGNGSFLCDIGAFESSTPLVADNTPCTLDNAILSANNDASVGGCAPGQGADVITLPEASVVNITASPTADGVGLQRINSAVIIEGNNSTIQRDPGALETFAIFGVEPGGDLLLRESTVTGGSVPPPPPPPEPSRQAMRGSALNLTGGIYSLYAAVGLEQSTVTNNNGAGIFSIYSRKANILDSTISGNTLLSSFAAGATLFYGYGATISGSSFINNQGYVGAGLDIRAQQGAEVTNSTLSGNSGAVATGLIFTGSGLLRGLTITANEAFATVAGVYTQNLFPFTPIRIDHTIVSGNPLVPPPPPPPGASFDIPGLPALNQILRGPPPATEFLHFDNGTTGPLINNGFNIFGENSLSGINFALAPSDIVPMGTVSTVIDPLADNGGFTLTHLPVAAGPAVDGGDTFCFLSVDQLGNPRPFDGNDDDTANCDIGSVEFGSFDDLIFADGFEPPFTR